MTVPDLPGSRISDLGSRISPDLPVQKIYAYKSWSAVLKALDLTPVIPEHVTANAAALGATGESKAASYGGGGESPAHKELKTFIAGQPNLLGLPAGLHAEVERPLPSGDILDVFFSHSGKWIGVEVKSAKSDIADITRGIFQCVKYLAVLEAEQMRDRISPNGQTFLVLESKLPKELISLRNSLGVQVIEGVSPRNQSTSSQVLSCRPGRDVLARLATRGPETPLLNR